VIAKIEKAEAVDALDAVLAETDAVMVARGDLGVEIGPALVPLVQKRIILEALDRGKPVITATQMLESMIHHPEPTRAEASDLAEALGAAALLVPTFTGRTASAVARLRPTRPIVALTHKRWSVHQMAIEWGVTPIWIPEAKNVEDLWNRSIEAAKDSGLVEPG